MAVRPQLAWCSRRVLLAMVGAIGAVVVSLFHAGVGRRHLARGDYSSIAGHGASFVSPPVLSAQQVRPTVHFSSAKAGGPARSPSPGAGAAAAGAVGIGSSVLFAALTVLCRTARSRTARYGAHTYERKWWSVEETADPTTLPLWQRDYRFGYQVLKRTMIEERKKGNKVFWDVRVVKQWSKGCTVEMLNSGLRGWCPISQEGKERLDVGDVVKMECTAVPTQRVNKEQKGSPWPKWRPSDRRFEPLFSHWLWLEQQHSIEKAKELKAGEIVKGTVYKMLGKGLVVTLEGPNEPKGMLAMVDISRKCSSHNYVERMFPPGTEIKCYVVHADTENGRITLSTKEFEDDDHMGWMLSFPERCFARADEAVRRYHEKRDAYIKMLQW